MATKKKIKIANPVDTSVSIKDAKAPIGAMKTTIMGLLKKGWEFDKKIFKSCWDFLKVGDVPSYIVGIMGLWLVYSAVTNIF
jgi:hypothetical protein